MFLYEYFEQIWQSNRDETALIFYKGLNNYNEIKVKELFNEYQNVTYHLTKHVPATAMVGIFLETNDLLPPIVLGVNKLKNPFICLNLSNLTKFPKFLKDLGPTWFLSSSSSFENLDLELKSGFTIFNKPIKLYKILGCSDALHDPDLCYVISTSGTTGEPKLVKVTNKCIMANILDFRSVFRISSKDVILLNTPITFDPYIVELFLSLTTLATLVICHPKVCKNEPSILENFFNQIGITFLQATPSVFLNFGWTNIENCLLNPKSSLRVLALGGEKFPGVEKMLNMKKKVGTLEIYNLYGITEVSCWASAYKLRDTYNEEDMIWKLGVPFGSPITDTKFVLFESGQAIQDGEGELYIECSNRKCFVSDEEPCCIDGETYRKTGDLVHLDEKTKEIYYIGRKDNLIKRYGHRISLEQIDLLISNYLKQRAISFYDHELNKLIIFLLENISPESTRNLKLMLQTEVSKAAVIDQICIIEKFPITVNGKVNPSQLKTEVTTATHETTVTFSDLCRSYLNLDLLDHSFQGLGGTSIIAMQIINQFEMFTKSTISGHIFEKMFDESISLQSVCDEVQGMQKETTNLEIKNTELLPRSVWWEDLKDFENYRTISIAWKYNMEACVDASPVIVYARNCDYIGIGSHSHKFSFLDAKTGRLKFETNLGDRIEGTAKTTIPFFNCVVVGCYNGFIYCIDLQNQRIKWSYETKSRVKATPSIILKGNATVIGSYDHKLHCIDIESGAKIWDVNLNGSISTQVMMMEGQLFVATINGVCYALDERLGTIIWNVDIQSPIFSSPAILDSNQIVWADAKGCLHCLNTIDGSEVWNFQCGGAVYSSIVTMHNKLYFGCYDHCLYELECLENNLVRCSKRIELDSPIFATPDLFCGFDKCLCLVTSVKGVLYILDMKGNKIIADFKLDGEVFSSPVLFSKYIFVGCRDDCIYSLNFDVKD